MSDSLREANDEISTLQQELAEARSVAEQDTACEAEIIAKAHLQQAYAENARLRLELRDRRTEDDELRGILSANGRPFGRVIPFPLGPSLVPAVEWLIAQVDAMRPVIDAFGDWLVAKHGWDLADSDSGNWKAAEQDRDRRWDALLDAHHDGLNKLAALARTEASRG